MTREKALSGGIDRLPISEWKRPLSIRISIAIRRAILPLGGCPRMPFSPISSLNSKKISSEY
jgi:hypothetical protein